MIRRTLLVLLASSLGTVAGAMVGMSLYLNSLPYQVQVEDRERAYWIAGTCGATGALGGTALTLIAVALTVKGESEEDRERRVIAYAREQLKRSDLSPIDAETWTELAGKLEATHQPRKRLIPRWLRSIW